MRFICGKFEPQVELERDLAGVPAAPTRRSPTSPAGTRTRRCSTRSATSAPRSSPTASTTPRSSTASGSPGPARKAVYEHADPDDLRAGARRGAGRRAVADRHRRGVQHGGRSGAARPSCRGRGRARGDPDRRRLTRHRRGRRDRPRDVLEHFGLLGDRIVIYTGTLGKALGGAAGGFVAGGEALCAVLEQRSRPQLFSNGLPPTVAAQRPPRAREAARTSRSWSPAARARRAPDARPSWRRPGSTPLRGRERDRPDHRR